MKATQWKYWKNLGKTKVFLGSAHATRVSMLSFSHACFTGKDSTIKGLHTFSTWACQNGPGSSFGPLLDPFWIPFGDHLGDVLALVGLFGALFGRQSAVILFILASDKAPKRTSDTLLERLEPGKLALEPLHISLGPLQSYLDPSRSYFRASKHQFLIIQCSNRTYVACQKHLLIIIDQVIRPPILGLFDLGEPLSFLAA